LVIDLHHPNHVPLRGMEHLMDLAEGDEPGFRL
jgi:hypothetical protein